MQVLLSFSTVSFFVGLRDTEQILKIHLGSHDSQGGQYSAEDFECRHQIPQQDKGEDGGEDRLGRQDQGSVGGGGVLLGNGEDDEGPGGTDKAD